MALRVDELSTTFDRAFLQNFNHKASQSLLKMAASDVCSLFPDPKPIDSIASLGSGQRRKCRSNVYLRDENHSIFAPFPFGRSAIQKPESAKQEVAR